MPIDEERRVLRDDDEATKVARVLRQFSEKCLTYVLLIASRNRLALIRVGD